MKVSYCAVCKKTVLDGVELFSVPSPSRHYFSVCRKDLNRWNDTITPKDGEEVLKIRATFADVVDTATAHTALLGQFPQDATIRVQRASSIRSPFSCRPTSGAMLARLSTPSSESGTPP